MSKHLLTGLILCPGNGKLYHSYIMHCNRPLMVERTIKVGRECETEILDRLDSLTIYFHYILPRQLK